MMGDPPILEAGERARQLHREAIVIDLHADTPSEFFLEPDYDFGARHTTGHIDLPRLREGGISAQFFIAWVPEEKAAPGVAFDHAMELVEAIHRVVGRTPGIRLVTSCAGLLDAVREGEVAALIGVEGGHAIENSIEKLEALYDRGARYMTLTWNNANDWADASCSPPRHGGLTAFGRQVVQAMNRLGMLVDVSHVSEDTFWDVLETTSAPVIASHSNARALADHSRNLRDEQLRALAQNGGVVGVNFFPTFLDARYAAGYERIEREATALRERLTRQYGDARRARAEARRWFEAEVAARLEPVPLTKLADHIEHIVQVAGIDHVGLGSDFDGIETLPAGLRDASDVPRLTELLLQRGWGEAEVKKLLGGNVLRVLGAVLG